MEADDLVVVLGKQLEPVARTTCGPNPVPHAFVLPNERGSSVAERVSGDQVKLRPLEAELVVQLRASPQRSEASSRAMTSSLLRLGSAFSESIHSCLAYPAACHLSRASAERVSMRATIGRSSSRRHCSRRPRPARRALTATLTSDSPAAVKAAIAVQFTLVSLPLLRFLGRPNSAAPSARLDDGLNRPRSNDVNGRPDPHYWLL
jgi:hypothetical protein